MRERERRGAGFHAWSRFFVSFSRGSGFTMEKDPKYIYNNIYGTGPGIYLLVMS